MTDLTEVHADTQGAALYIWGAVAGTRPAPDVATLRTLVARAVEASDAGAFKVEIQLADGRWLHADEIRQLHSRFEAERRAEWGKMRHLIATQPSHGPQTFSGRA